MLTLLKGGRLINVDGPGGQLDVLVGDGVILRIGQDLEEAEARVMNCEGMYIMPGFVDMHCHLREPGYEYKETIQTGARAAAHGGFTSVCCMANTDPVNDSSAVTRFIIERAREALVHVYPVGAITKGLEGKELAEIGEMSRSGVVALSDDGLSVTNARLMRNAMLYSLPFELPLLSHCEDKQLSEGGSMNEGRMSTLLGLKGIPRSAEESLIARDIQLAAETGARLHIQHVSTRGGVELVRRAKADGLSVTAETCPHYVALTDEACEGYNVNARVNPPLRTQRDIDALIEGLKDGTIDCIATDHAPHHRDEKQCEFALSQSGISGFETAFAVVWTALALPGHLSPEAIVEKMSAAPARILGRVQGGGLSVGAPADIAVVSPNDTWTVDASMFLSRGKNTPFEGERLTGRVKATFVDGEVVFEEGFTN